MEKLEKTKKEKKGIFERIYKSKTARALTFLSFLGISSNLLPKQKHEYQPPQQKQELIEHQQELELKELSDKFKIKKEIDKERNIIHISQLHGAESIAQTQEKADIKEIISNQKDIEELMLFLSEEYDISNFYAEGLLEEDLKFINTTKEYINKDNNLPIEKWHKLLNLKNTINTEESKNQIPDRHRAYLLYLIKTELSKETKQLEKYKKEEAPKEYKEMFNQWNQENINPEEIYTNLKKHTEHTSNHPLIKEDNIYIFGAPAKLYIEGKINIEAAETIEANKKAFSPYSDQKTEFTQEELKDPEKIKEFQEILEQRKNEFKNKVNIREDAAIDTIMDNPDSKNQKYIPLIYGKGHDFKDNIEQHNNKNPDQKIGLIKIVSK
ncbi:MAG: hypothetical protein GF387_00650 [Candidatus Portnoybacteria bacterium]|nr:hypothetical protein [Candidatus Portnoybacteria bacterium]